MVNVKDSELVKNTHCKEIENILFRLYMSYLVLFFFVGMITSSRAVVGI